jgi:hypothetical protein
LPAQFLNAEVLDAADVWFVGGLAALDVNLEQKGLANGNALFLGKCLHLKLLRAYDRVRAQQD